MFIIFIVTIAMILLFNACILAALKLEFKSQAVKNAIFKTLGYRFTERYKRVFVFLIFSFFISLAVSFVLYIKNYNFGAFYIIAANLFTSVNIMIISVVFIKNYESKCIVNV